MIYKVVFSKYLVASAAALKILWCQTDIWQSIHNEKLRWRQKAKYVGKDEINKNNIFDEQRKNILEHICVPQSESQWKGPKNGGQPYTAFNVMNMYVMSGW